jgi:hypothetical protein
MNRVFVRYGIKLWLVIRGRRTFSPGWVPVLRGAKDEGKVSGQFLAKI